LRRPLVEEAHLWDLTQPSIASVLQTYNTIALMAANH
jgi:hypothetical protein